MENDIDSGDWVRFYQNGRLVIGRVEYISKTLTGSIVICTDIGSVSSDSVMEVRKK